MSGQYPDAAHINMRDAPALLAEHSGQEHDIAVIGIACRFGGDATNPSNFWELLCEARNAHSTTARFEPQANGETGEFPGHYLQDDVYTFDNNFFDISPKEAKAMDPSQRLALEISWEAFESAGLPMSSLVGTDTSCYAAQWATDYREMLCRDPDAAPAYTVTGTGTAMLSNRLSWFLDLRGPSMTLNTACSSGMVALHEACKGLRHGEASKSLVVGSNLILNSDMFTFLRSQNFLAADGKCKAFDQSGDGYGRGEGVAAVVLQPVQAAVRDGNPIRAVIRGSGVNQNGRMKGITLPSVDAQETLIRKTYESAGLDFAETSYVESHGTGTKAGDPVELEALARTIGREHDQDNKLQVGTVKPNIGHTEATAGLAGVIKGVLALETGTIPPNIHLSEPNKAIPFDEWNMKVPTSLTKLPEDVRRISVCSTGYGGTNAHIILDDARSYLENKGIADAVHFTTSGSQEIPKAASTRITDQHQRLFIISANDESGVKRQAQSLLRFFEQQADVVDDEQQFLDDFAHTLNQRRTHMQWMAPLTASSLQELKNNLSTFSVAPSKRLASYARLCFVFTGQGAQWPRMGKTLYAENSYFRASVDGAEEFFNTSLGCDWSVTGELFREPSSSRMEDPTISQPLTTVIQIALIDMLAQWNISPELIVGHSSGEIAAAVCLGALSTQQAWTVAYYRGVFKPKREGSMLAVGLSESEAKTVLEEQKCEHVVVACINSPKNVTLSGNTDQILMLESIFKDRGTFARRLKVRTAYHSPHIQDIAGLYEEAIKDVQPKPAIPGRQMYSAVTGTPVDAKDLSPSYWVRNLVSPVRFSAAVSSILENSGNKSNAMQEKKSSPPIFVEIGPHAALQGPLKQIFADSGLKAVEYTSMLLRDKDDAATSMSSAGSLYALGVGVNLDSVNYVKPNQSLGKILVNLPPYAWKHDQSFNAVTTSMQTKPTAAQQSQTRQLCSIVDWEPASDSVIRPNDPSDLACKEVAFLVPSQWSSDMVQVARKLTQSLKDLKCAVRTISWPHDLQDAKGRDCISLVDLDGATFMNAKQEEFDALQAVVTQSKSLLWLSHNNASGSIVPGLARTIRSEVPGVNFRCLQLDNNFTAAKDSFWADVVSIAVKSSAESEFRSVNGNLMVPRVKTDEGLDRKVEHYHGEGGEAQKHQLRSDASYLLVGGLGGLGRSIAHSMVDRGARHICFISRSGAASHGAQKLLNELRERSVKSSAYKADVANLESLGRAFEQCQEEHPAIAGIIQCAMVLRDVAFSSMTYQQWQECLQPKVQGSYNITQVMPQDVDFFIMLSSFTCIFGNRTQGNYVAACAYQDGLAHECRSRGINAVSLDLGVMRDVGYLAEHGSKGALKEWESDFGVREWELRAMLHAAMMNETPTQFITGLPTADGAKQAGIRTPFFMKDPKFSYLAKTSAPRQQDTPENEDTKQPETTVDVKESLPKVQSRQEARELVGTSLQATVAEALQASIHDIDMTRPLHAHGVDSLTAIEIQSWLFSQLKTSIFQDDLMADVPLSSLVDAVVTKCELIPSSALA